jgi:beta-galactosidase
MIVEDYDALLPEVLQSVEFLIPELSGFEPPKAALWCDILAPQNAEVIARYTHGYYAGKPAITLNRFGRGQAVYVGTFGLPPLYRTFFGWLLGQLGIHCPLIVPDGVETAERWQGEQHLLFILNHTSMPQTIFLPDDCVNLLNSQLGASPVTVAPHDVLILAMKKAERGSR